MDGTAAAEALAKAKAIALKLSKTVPSENNNDSSTSSSQPQKRKRWGTDPNTDDHDDPLKRYKSYSLSSSLTSDDKKICRKIKIPVDTNPGYNYVGLLIGPRGTKQKALQQEAGGRVKIQVRGKGANDATATPMDEPLHVFLEGDADCVDKAEILINDLLQNPEKADAEKSRQLSELGINHNESGGGIGSSSYKPMPVAQIIGGSIIGASAAETMEEQIGVPNGVVGYIIGKGGESITSMQRRSGCRVQIQKEHDMEPGTNTRIITLSAATQDAIDQCRTIIEQMVEERQRLNAQQNGTQQLQQAIAVGQQLVHVAVPDADVGLIIGKGGCNIRAIQDRSGANIQIPQQADADNPLIRTCTITHPTLDGANFAKQMVEDILSTKADKTGGTGGTFDFSLQILIPDNDVGMVIGRQGCVIREMQMKTGTKIQIPSQATPGVPNRIATVTGNAEGCHIVKGLIERMISEQTSHSVMANSGVPPSQWQTAGSNNNYSSYGGGSGYAQQQYGQQQQNPYAAAAASYGQQYAYSSSAATSTTPSTTATGEKTDYSQEWAAYYAQIQQQSSGTDATAAAAAQDSTSSTPANPNDPTQYYDQFFRYAIYYGEEAARKTYGAWSPPVGTPNPYANATGGAAVAPATSSQSTS